MKINAGPGTLVLLGQSYSLLFQKQSGEVTCWPVENDQLLSLFPERYTITPQILDPHVVGLFSTTDGLGFISKFPAQTVSVNVQDDKAKIKLPATVWATSGNGYVRFAGLVKPEEPLTMNSAILDIVRAMPNATGPFAMCFGNNRLPTSPTGIFDEFLRRPFTSAFSTKDFQSLVEKESNDESRGLQKDTIADLLPKAN